MAKLKMNRFYYRPLPDNLTIGQSEIDGYGIFAKEAIGKVQALTRLQALKTAAKKKRLTLDHFVEIWDVEVING